MAEEKKTPTPEAAAEEEKKGGNMILLIGIIVGIVIIQTVLVYLIVPKPGSDEAKALKAERDSIRLAEEAARNMGDVTTDAPIEAIVNIALGTEEERILKVVVALEYDGKNVKLGEELRRRTPEYKDMLLRHLRSLSPRELAEPGIEEKIGKDLLRMINNNLPVNLGEAKKVIFRDFIIQ